MNLELRLAQASDVSSIVRLVNSVYRGEEAKKSWTTEANLLDGLRIDEPTLHSILKIPSHSILVLDRQSDFPQDAKIAGCVHLELSPQRICHLGMLSVSASEQQSGLGTQLLAKAETYAQDHLNASAIQLDVISVRSELLQWYFRRGYELTGESFPFAGDATRLSSFKKDPLTFLILKKTLPLS